LGLIIHVDVAGIAHGWAADALVPQLPLTERFFDSDKVV